MQKIPQKTVVFKDIKLTKIQIKLSKNHVRTDIPQSGLWPRITLEYYGKSKVIPMTWYSLQDKRNRDFEIQSEVLKFIGMKRSELAIQDIYDLKMVSKGIRNRIEKVIKRATNKGSVAKRQKATQRRIRKTLFLEKLKRFCEAEGKTLQYEDLRPADFGAVWDDVRRMKVTLEVMDS